MREVIMESCLESWKGDDRAASGSSSRSTDRQGRQVRWARQDSDDVSTGGAFMCSRFPTHAPGAHKWSDEPAAEDHGQAKGRGGGVIRRSLADPAHWRGRGGLGEVDVMGLLVAADRRAAARDDQVVHDGDANHEQGAGNDTAQR